jgi:hypothetical protein
MKTLSDYARSIRYAGVVTMIATASALQACSTDTIPTEPSSVTRAPSPAPAQLRVSGTVTDDDGMPVAGAKVTLYRWTTVGEPCSVVTDSKGFYSVSLVSAAGISAFTEKAGYESTWQSRSIALAADLQLDLRIHRIKQ